MDVARRCYTARCRFIAGQPPGIIRWYFPLPGATLYPGSTAFGGSQFDRGTGLGYVGPGEVRDGLIRFVPGTLRPRGPGLSLSGIPIAFQQGLTEPCHAAPVPSPRRQTRTQTLDGLNDL